MNRRSFLKGLGSSLLLVPLSAYTEATPTVPRKYDPRNMIVTVGGVQVTGFTDTDPITLNKKTGK